MSCCLVPFIKETNYFLEAVSLSFLIFLKIFFFPLLLPGKIFPNISVTLLQFFSSICPFGVHFAICSPTNTEQCQVSWCQGLPMRTCQGKAWQPGPIPSHPIPSQDPGVWEAPGQPQATPWGQTKAGHQPVNLQLRMARPALWQALTLTPHSPIARFPNDVVLPHGSHRPASMPHCFSLVSSS